MKEVVLITDGSCKKCGGGGWAAILRMGEVEKIIELPSYFDALNITIEYQLTSIGCWAQTYIKEEVKNNKFKIALNSIYDNDVVISWQVTGVRNDRFAQKNRVVPETLKEIAGEYLHPECWN